MLFAPALYAVFCKKIVNCKHLKYEWADGGWVGVDDFTYNFAPGEKIGIVGKNGVGKSTTFKSILGLISKDDGEITILGKDISDINEDDMQRIGVVLSDSGFSGYLSISDIIPILSQLY